MSEVTTAKIFATVNGGEYSAEGLRFEMDVNSFPMVSANIAETNGAESVKVPVSSEVIERIGKLQQQRLAGRTKPDFNVEADDGTGGKISYKGFISSPILEITKVSTIDKIASVGEAALIDALDLSIYKAGYVTERLENSSNGGGEQLKPIPAAKDGDVPGTLREITNVLVDNFAVTRNKEYRALSKQLLDIQHGINTNGPLDLWQELLGASDVKFESWPAALKKVPTIARQLSENVKLSLTARTPGFWNTIRALMSNFQMYDVPEFDGVGRFERADKKTADPEVTMEVSVSGISVADGSPRILQPGGVVMMGPATPAERAEAEANPQIPRIVAYAPDPLLQGFIEQAPIPFWLVREGGIPIFGSEVDTRGSTAAGAATGVDLSLPARNIRKKKGLAYKREADTVSEGVMTELCEVMFKELQLQHATAGLTLPLDFKLNSNVGKRATIKIRGKDGKDGGSFTAFVTGITHSVDLRAGKQLNSYTQVRLSHAKFFS